MMHKFIILLFIILSLIACYFAWQWLSTDPYWTYGDLGSYIGGTLGGIAVLILIYTTWEQQKEIQKQNERAEEEEILRKYEILYPEITGCAAQIISRAWDVRSLLFEHREQELEDKKKQMLQGDRGTFLRIILDWHEQVRSEKVWGSFDIMFSKYKDREDYQKLMVSIQRFQTLCQFLFELDSSKKHTNLYKALWQTEVGRAYHVLKDVNLPHFKK